MANWPNSDSRTQDILSQKQAEAMFWHLRTVFSNCLGSECVFSAEEWKVEQEQHLALVTENTLNMAFLFIYPAPPPPPPPPPPPRPPPAPRICVMFWVMISSLLWLTSYTARQASNTQVAGEMGSTTRTYIILMRVFCSKGGEREKGLLLGWERGKLLRLAGLFISHLLSSSLFSALSFNPRSLEWPEAELVNYYHIFDTPEAN